MIDNLKSLQRDHPYITSSHFWDFWTPPTSACFSRSTLYIPALTLPFSSVFFDSFSITLLYSRRRGSWLWHSPVNTNTAIICVMGVSLNLTTPIKFSLTLINTDVHCILCKVYNRVDSSNITRYSTFSDFSGKKLKLNFDGYI